MKVFHDLNELPAFKNAVVTIGSFDGVHMGHQKLLEKVNRLAERIGGESVVITFHPHPRMVIYPKDDSLRLLTTIDEKVKLFEKFGVQNLVVVPFTVEFSQLTADQYIEDFLCKNFHPKYVVIGYDHRFGLNRQGDINYLKWYGTRKGFQVVEIPRQEIEAMAVSSTKIRTALEKGEVDRAEKFLHHYFTLSGNVVKGKQIGNQIGFPTANLEVNSAYKLIPPEGIYAVFVKHKDKKYKGMLYIGRRPSLKDNDQISVEVNIFDFHKNIYGDKLQLDLVAFLREDAAYPSLEELAEQLKQDKKDAQQALRQAEESLVAEKAKPQQPSVAVVVLNFNTRDLLEKLLPSVLSSTYSNLQVVVADNGSSDHSSELIRQLFPQVELIELPENIGFAAGYNEALKFVVANYYVLLNTDVEVGPDWIDPVIEEMEKDKSIAAAQPKIKDYYHRERFEYAGAAGGWIDYLGYPLCRGRIFSTIEKDEGQYDSQQEIFWASGAAMFVRGQLFHQLGGFDGDYFAHLEEIDFCWRLKRAGFKVMAMPQTEVFHIGGGTLQYESPHKTYLNFRNSLFTIYKNESTRKLLWLIPLRLILDGFAAVLFLAQGKTAHIKSILQAHRDFYRQLKKLREKRIHYVELINRYSISPEYNNKGVYHKSVVWQYFALGRKQFKNLG